MFSELLVRNNRLKTKGRYFRLFIVELQMNNIDKKEAVQPALHVCPLRCAARLPAAPGGGGGAGGGGREGATAARQSQCHEANSRAVAATGGEAAEVRGGRPG